MTTMSNINPSELIDHGNGCGSVDQSPKDIGDILGDEQSENCFVNDAEAQALEILTEAVTLFQELNDGVVLAARAEHLEKVSKIYALQPSIILFAYKNGIPQAHNHFLKKEFRSECKGNVASPNSSVPSMKMKEPPNTPTTLSPPTLSPLNLNL